MPRRRAGLPDEEALDQRAIELRQALKVGDADMFIHLVDAGIHRPDLDALRSQRGDEAGVGRAAAGAFFGRSTGKFRQHLAGGRATQRRG